MYRSKIEAVLLYEEGVLQYVIGIDHHRRNSAPLTANIHTMILEGKQNAVEVVFKYYLWSA